MKNCNPIKTNNEPMNKLKVNISLKIAPSITAITGSKRDSREAYTQGDLMKKT